MIQLSNVFKFYKTQHHTKIVLDHVSTLFGACSYGCSASTALANQPPCDFSLAPNFQTPAKCGDLSASLGRLDLPEASIR